MKGQGLVEYALVLVLVVLVIIALITIISDLSGDYGVVRCPDGVTYTGKVNTTRYNDVYLVTTESGKEVRAPKNLCVFEKR